MLFWPLLRKAVEEAGTLSPFSLFLLTHLCQGTAGESPLGRRSMRSLRTAVVVGGRPAVRREEGWRCGPLCRPPLQGGPGGPPDDALQTIGELPTPIECSHHLSGLRLHPVNLFLHNWQKQAASLADVSAGLCRQHHETLTAHHLFVVSTAVLCRLHQATPAYPRVHVHSSADFFRLERRAAAVPLVLVSSSADLCR